MQVPADSVAGVAMNVAMVPTVPVALAEKALSALKMRAITAFSPVFVSTTRDKVVILQLHIFIYITCWRN